MHMGNEVLSPAVALGFGAATIGILSLCARNARKSLEGRQIPLMGMMGALVFAAQMVNFQILGGSSGHLGGGALLAISLGPGVAVFVMSAVLFIQALLFNDGGLLALGTNIFNMGILPAFIGTALFRIIAGGPAREVRSAGRVYLGCFSAGLMGVTAGAVMVPIQIGLSGLLADGVSLSWFFATMTWVHLIVGAVEGVITFMVVAYLYHTRPELLPGATKVEGRVGPRPILASLGIGALVIGVFLSMMASGLPDGLEYVLGTETAGEGAGADKTVGGRSILRETSEDSLMHRVNTLQEKVAVLPDYTRQGAEEASVEEGNGFFRWDTFQAISALVGSILTLFLAFLVGKLLLRRSRGEARPSA
ncbi:MAG: energy-coupling factor ABC transporter permease [Planctomycetota bacterium]|jgi:cobalt/nickel transport system permease protein